MYNVHILDKKGVFMCKYENCYNCFIHAEHINICARCPCLTCSKKCDKKFKLKKGTKENGF
jgi:hypothetical protein